MQMIYSSFRQENPDSTRFYAILKMMALHHDGTCDSAATVTIRGSRHYHKRFDVGPLFLDAYQLENKACDTIEPRIVWHRP